MQKHINALLFPPQLVAVYFKRQLFVSCFILIVSCFVCIVLCFTYLSGVSSPVLPDDLPRAVLQPVYVSLPSEDRRKQQLVYICARLHLPFTPALNEEEVRREMLPAS